MAKDNKNMEFFRQGMFRAYQLVKKDGIEALEKELRFRNVTKINGPLLAKELDGNLDQIRKYIMHTVSTMAAGVLYSEFGFGKMRLERFSEAFIRATDSLADGIVTWADICYNIEDLTGYHSKLIEDLDEKTGMLKE